MGVAITPKILLRFHARHSNNFTGVQSFWNFNGQPYIPPDSDQLAHQNNFLASTELTIQASSHWQHRISGFEYNHKRSNLTRSWIRARFAVIWTDRLPVRQRCQSESRRTRIPGRLAAAQLGTHNCGLSVRG